MQFELKNVKSNRILPSVPATRDATLVPCLSEALPWGVQKDKLILTEDRLSRRMLKVELRIDAGRVKKVVRFGTFHTLEEAVRVRDMAVLKFRADRRSVVQQGDSFARMCLQLDWGGFWNLLRAVKVHGRQARSWAKAETEELLKRAWVANHKVLAGDTTLDTSIRERAQQLAWDMACVLGEEGDEDSVEEARLPAAEKASMAKAGRRSVNDEEGGPAVKGTEQGSANLTRFKRQEEDGKLLCSMHVVRRSVASHVLVVMSLRFTALQASFCGVCKRSNPRMGL